MRGHCPKCNIWFDGETCVEDLGDHVRQKHPEFRSALRLSR